MAEQEKKNRNEEEERRPAKEADPEEVRTRKLQILTGMLCVLIVALIVALVYEVVLV